MQSFTWPGQSHRDHIVDYDENTYLTGWRLGCTSGILPLCRAAASQYELGRTHGIIKPATGIKNVLNKEDMIGRLFNLPVSPFQLFYEM